MYKDRDLSILKIVERIFLHYENKSGSKFYARVYYIKIPQCIGEKKRTIINIPVGKPIYYIRTRQSRAVDLLSGVDETDRSIL